MNSICGKALSAISALLLGMTFITSANAQFTPLTDLSNFSGGEDLIDFTGAATAQGDPVAAVNGVLFALSPSGPAPRFSNQDIGPRPFGPQGVEAIDAAASGAPSNPYADLEIAFPNAVNRVGFVINANSNNTIDVTALNGGVIIVDQKPFLTSATGGFTFIGFETDDPIDEVRIEIGNAQGSGFWRFDNLRYEPFDADTDDDGVPDEAPDNCPLDANTDQLDSDNDGLGDVCDACPFDADNDADGDGACGDIDAEVDFSKTRVYFDDGKIKIDGDLSLPSGYWSDNLNPTGTATVMLGNTAVADQGPFDFELSGSADKKWKFNYNDPEPGEVKKFKIDWKGSKFDFVGDDGLKLKTTYIGGAETTLEIRTGSHTGAFTVTVNGTVIEYDIERNITANVDFESYSDDNKKVYFTLPYQLQPEMVVEISGSVIENVLVADHYNEGRVKFSLETRFDPALLPAAGNTTPATLELFVTLGETVYSYGVIAPEQWDDINVNQWKR